MGILDTSVVIELSNLTAADLPAFPTISVITMVKDLGSEGPARKITSISLPKTGPCNQTVSLFKRISRGLHVSQLSQVLVIHSRRFSHLNNYQIHQRVNNANND